jgi:HD-GYP domain-containing protein (c-di-GMP phosphodiesterase class II)
MVRFTDIIKDKDDKAPKPPKNKQKEKEGGFRVSDSGIFKSPDKKDAPEMATKKKTANIEVVTYYERFIERAQDIQQRVKNDQGISPSPILADLHAVIDKNLIDQLYEYAMSARGDYDEMLIHTVDVTFTALKIGKGINYDIKTLLRLGLATFLENVGMYKIPERILKSTRKLSEEEIRLIKKHPEISYEILSQLGERYKWLADVVLKTHERYDGSGYPSGLKGDEIPELASIIGLVDTYIAMIKNRPYREKFIQTDAIKSIVEASKGRFSPRILKIFLDQISFFPVGSYIKLNNGSIGRVISTEKNQPLRPTIELLYDGSGKKLANPQTIQLSDNPLLFIDSSVNADSLQS